MQPFKHRKEGVKIMGTLKSYLGFLYGQESRVNLSLGLLEGILLLLSVLRSTVVELGFRVELQSLAWR